MDHYEMFNDILVNLFNEIQGLEEKALTSSKFQDISGNDMHIIDAIGIKEARNMSSVAKSLAVTVGTLTIAINNLVKKGYVNRERSHQDRRVVLISLSPLGVTAYEHHKKFHEDMIQELLGELSETETHALVKALNKLRIFFRDYQEKE